MSSAKRFRSVVHKVNESRLYENLKTVYMNDSNPTYKWDGSHYGKGRGPNEDAVLADSEPVLKEFVIEAIDSLLPLAQKQIDAILNRTTN